MAAALRRQKHFITETGLEDIKKEYDFLVTTRRASIIARLQQTREMGDLAENSAYDEVREEQVMLESRIEELEKALNSYIVSQKTQEHDFVVIGSSIVVEIDGQRDEFSVVGTMEANPAKRMISNESPVGKALLGARVGETVEVVTPIVRAKYKILEIK